MVKQYKKYSRKGLEKKEKDETKFRLIGSIEEGDIASVKVVGYIEDDVIPLFNDLVFRGEAYIRRKVALKNKKATYDLIEATITMKWDKYGRKIQ